MIRLSRRGFFIGLAAAACAVAAPATVGGTASFLRRVLHDHFGAEVAAHDGVDDFVRAYVDSLAQDDMAKRAMAGLYFAWHGDRVHKIGAAAALEQRFLSTILVRSNIIALWHGNASAFEFTEADPWVPTCGLYLSALAETA
jgi:hypothetical protein